MSSGILGVVLLSLLLFVWNGNGATTPRSPRIQLDYIGIPKSYTNSTTGTGAMSPATASPGRNTSRLCENKDQFYFNETKKCYFPSNSLAVTFIAYEDIETPCGELQHFYSASENYGDCDCIRLENGCSGRKVFHRPVLNWPGAKRCYFAYDQGPCKYGEWLVMNPKTFQSECKPNPCLGLELQAPIERPNKPEIEVFWFLKGNTCYQTFTNAFCKEGQYVQFSGTSQYPSCFETQFRRFCGVATGTTTSLPCAQGTKKIGDKCVPEVQIGY